ncbi:DUF805 domain-containing protein [Haloimpatiens sp. FM7330]|uniref:DUF805 domain-containing protein n=1 Tax=Haloimpatiens sp. FM7330 TaxID=3298610 RepID=UPI003641DAD9
MTNFFSSKGRINRGRYLGYSILIYSILSILSMFLKMYNSNKLNIAFLIIVGICIAKNILITIQRFHDIEKSGYRVLMFFIPIYNIYLQLVLLFKKGTESENEYGKPVI